ncbi:MAG: hypothetical protein RL324_1954 [Verrucomicrobiota bacterium]|jgi:hypothetical protein
MTISTPPTPLRQLRPLFALAVLGLGLLAGRFDWIALPQPAQQGYILSAFFFLLLLSGSFAFWSAQGHAPTKKFWWVLTLGTIALNFPLHLFRLERVFYYGSHPHSFARQATFAPEWIGASPPWTETDWMFSAILLAGLAAGWLLRRRARQHGNPANDTLCRPALVLALFIIITAQLWLHHSLRSPYSYVPHFEKPRSENYTSTLSLLPDNRGLTNADVDYYTRLEELFLGTSENVPTLFVRRAFVFYLSGNLSYFLGPYHSFLIVNLVVWLAALLAFYRLIAGLIDPRTAHYATLLMAVGPGFIMFAAQPMSYFVGYAAVALMLLGVYRGMTSPRPHSLAAIYSSAVVVSLALLTTDLFVWLPALVLFPLLVGRSWRHTLAACLLAAAAYALYLWLVFDLLRLPHDDLNDKQLFEAVSGTLAILKTPGSPALYLALTTCLGEYLRQLSQAFFLAPVLLAVGGMFWADDSRLLRRIALLWLLPSFATFFVMHLGQSYLGSLPRFNFVAYPGIYLLAAAFLVWIDRAAKTQGWPRAGVFGAYGLVGLCAVLANIDSLGLMSHLYYYFYYSSGGHFS